MSYIMNLRKYVGTAPIIMVGACVLIFNEKNELLLQLRKDNGCWGLAGGSMEIGESIEEVATREMLEETGLYPEKLQFFKAFSGKEFYYQYPHGDEVYIVANAFSCHQYNGQLKPDVEEAYKLQFFHLSNLPKNISPPDAPIIKEYLAVNYSI